MVKVNIAEPVFGQQVGEHELRIHGKSACAGQPCPFHRPSDHKMKNWPINIRMDNKCLVERMCEHGVGHPDPDSVAYFKRTGFDYMSIHGCDGCCGDIK